MTLAAGTRLGPYEILSPLGAGGMGEVYRARDERLKREVAIKVLPASYSADPDRLRRFEREAQAAGSLNHPNITAVYDIGTHEGAPFVVQELLEGETLQMLLIAGPLSTSRAIDYGIQIAHGLAAAHEKGIVHRDVKPSNVFVTRGGLVKILDFGLAKLVRPDSSPVGDDLSTATAQTLPDIVVGTVGYLSPEQVRAEPVDPRSDIFSFGILLFEMLTGKRAFAGSAADAMAAILKDEPEDITEIAPKVSAELQGVVKHCLEKDRAARFHSARDLAFVLEVLSRSSRSGDRGSDWSSARPIYRRLTFRRGMITNARFSPDSEVIYSARWEGGPRESYVIRQVGPESRPLGLPAGAGLAAVSTSGDLALLLDFERSLQTARGVLARMPLAGGAPRELLENVAIADWLPDGRDLAVVRIVGERAVLDFPAGQTVYETTGWISSMRVSPSGTHVALVDHPKPRDAAGSIVLLDRRGRVQTLSDGWNCVWGLAWASADEVWFTGSRTGLIKAVHAVTRECRLRVVEQLPGDLQLFDIASDGAALLALCVARSSILCRSADHSGEKDLSWFDYSFGPRLSSDGRKVLFTEAGEAEATPSVYLRGTDGAAAVKLGEGVALALSPDGRWVLALASSRDSLVLIPTGAGKARELPNPLLRCHGQAAWFPDGKRVVFAANRPGERARSYAQALDESEAMPITPEGTIAYAVSPDGRMVAAADAEPRLYPVDGGSPREIPGAYPGDVPIGWNRDGSLLFVRTGFLPAKVARIDMVSGKREVFFELNLPDTSGLASIGPIALTPDADSYAFSYEWRLSDLYLVRGLR